MCDAGYYCTGKSITPRPTGGTANGGDICTAGGYCEQGSTGVKSCQGGYYNPDTGKQTIYDCIECLPGQYCSGSNLAAPNGDCSDGYYCAKGSSLIDQFPEYPGYFSDLATTGHLESDRSRGICP